MDKKINLADLERENEQLRRQLAELDELPTRKGGRTVTDLKGVQNITTSVSKGIRAIPGGEDRYYLDLYLLQKERERLVKETASIKKRRLQLGIKVSNVDKEMAEKEENALQDMTILSTERHEKPGEEKATRRNQKAPKRYEYKEEEWNKFTLKY